MYSRSDFMETHEHFLKVHVTRADKHSTVNVTIHHHSSTRLVRMHFLLLNVFYVPKSFAF